MQHKSHFQAGPDGEEDPSFDCQSSERRDKLDELSSDSSDYKPQKNNGGLLTASDLEENKNEIKKKLGDFTMSGLTSNLAASNIGAGQDPIKQLEDSQLDTSQLSNQEEENDDPNSLENRLKKIRMNLNFDYNAENNDSKESARSDYLIKSSNRKIQAIEQMMAEP